MGKGDRKTARGKRFRGTYGVRRPHRKRRDRKTPSPARSRTRQNRTAG